jgi:MFS family permease
LVVLNSTVASSLPSLVSPQLQEHFNVRNDYQLVLPNSVFLIGYILGPMLWAPLSENYGRRWVIVSTYLIYMVFVMGTALAPSWSGFLFFRFLSGLFGSTPISVTGGLFADILVRA